MSTGRRFIATLTTLTLLGSCAIVMQAPMTGNVCFAQNPRGTVQPTKQIWKKSPPKRASRTPVDPYAKDVKKSGNVIVVTKQFADLVKNDNTIILSKVAIKQRLDENKKIAGYELVSIDQGSVVEKIGAKPHDIVTSVNGIPVSDLDAHQKSLESSDRFEVTFLRKGKARRLVFEIR